MSILSRFKDLVRANLNDLISKAEDPEKSLNLYIEDASEHLRQFTIEVSRFDAERIMLQKRIKSATDSATEWHKQAEGALKQGREELVRKVLLEEQKATNQAESLQVELGGLEETAQQLHEQHQLLQEKLSEAKEKREDLIRRNRLAQAQKGATSSLSGMGKDDPLAKFDRMEEVVERREAEAKASYLSMTNSLSYEMRELKKDQLNSQVDDALSKLRAEMAEREG